MSSCSTIRIGNRSSACCLTNDWSCHRPQLSLSLAVVWPLQLNPEPLCGQGGNWKVWKLERLGCNLAHRVHTVHDLSARGLSLRVLAGQGAQIDNHRGRAPPVRHIRGAGRVRMGADPCMHLGRALGRGGAAGHLRVRTLHSTRDQTCDALQERRAPGRVARAWREGPRDLNRSVCEVIVRGVR